MADVAGRLPVEVLIKRESAAWTSKLRWEQLLRECYEFALPNRNLYFSGDGVTGAEQGAGQKKTDRLFDSTAPVAVMKLANRIQSNLTPPFTRWGKIVPGPLLKEQQRSAEQAQEIMQILEQVNRQLFTLIAVSNFDSAAGEFYLDLVTAGLAVMQIVDNIDTMASPVNFVTIPQSQVAIEEGPWGAIWAYYRRHRMPVHLLEHHWPDAKTLETPKGQTDEEWMSQKVDVKEVTYWSPKADRWLYDVILVNKGDGKQKDSARIVERQYKTNRLVAARWSKSAGEVQGRSPVMLALPDIKTLNLVKEFTLRNASIAVSGMWIVDQSQTVQQGKIAIRPGAQIAVRNTAGNKRAAVEPLQRPEGFDVAQLVIEDLKQSINDILMNKSLPPDTGPVRSATEIVERMKELSQDLGAPFGRLISEFLRPLITSVLGVLHDMGVIVVNENAIKVDGAFVDIEVQSPMAASQELAEVETTIQWLQILQSLGQEAFLLNAKIEDIGAGIGQKLGVPSEFIRPAQERKDMQGMAGQMLGMQQGQGGASAGIPVNSNAPPPARIAA